MDVKATFSGNDRQAILSHARLVKMRHKKLIESALASDAEISADTRKLITDQQSSLKTSHDLIKKYRDVQEAVNG